MGVKLEGLWEHLDDNVDDSVHDISDYVVERERQGGIVSERNWEQGVGLQG